MSSTVKSEKRETTKQSQLTELRHEGKIPAVVYGYGMESTTISVIETDLLKTLREVGRNGVIKLEVDGKKVDVVLSDYQMDILKGQMMHADFLAINMKEELEVNVLISPTGDSKGVSEGGILQQPNREVTVKVKPSDIPDTIEVDVSELEVGGHISVGDIREKVEYDILNDDEYTLFSVLAPRLESETTDEEGEAAEDSTDSSTDDSTEGEEAETV